MPTTPLPTVAAAPPPPSAENGDPFGEGDPSAQKEQEGPQVPLHWVSLDARTGRLLCPSLSLEVAHFTGQITEKRLVRVFAGGHSTEGHDLERHDENDLERHDEEGGALCASSNRRVADHGRPGRECDWCEDLGACTPRWRITWEGVGKEEPGTGLTFAHTLTAAETIAFTRYALALRREGLRSDAVLTRFSVEKLPCPGAEKVRWQLRFEKIGTVCKIDTVKIGTVC